MKRLVLLLLLIAVSLSLSASSLLVGIEGGYSYSMIQTSTGWTGTYNTNGHGFDIAMPVEYRFNDWFSLSSGIRWMMKSSEYIKTSADGENILEEYTRMHHVVEIPLTLRFSFSVDDFRFFAGGGAYIGVRTIDVDAGEIRMEISSVDNLSGKKEFYQHVPFEADDNLFDAGIIAELGASYELGDYGSFYLLGRYQYGLTSLAKGSYVAAHSYFDNICVDIGFLWRVI